MKAHKTEQLKQQLKAGPLRDDSGLVFTDDIGRHPATQTVYKAFKRRKKAPETIAVSGAFSWRRWRDSNSKR